MNFCKACLCSLLLASSAMAQATFDGDLFYTLFTNGLEMNIEADNPGVDVVPIPKVVNVKSVHYSWDAGTQKLTLSNITDIAQTDGADGILVSPDKASLLIGGQTNEVYRVPIDGSAIGNPGLIETKTLPVGAESFHLAMDPSQTKLWTSDQPDTQISEVPLDFSQGVTSHPVTGDKVTQLGFAQALSNAAPNHAYYTSADPTGIGGDFGIMDLTTFTADTKIAMQDGAHSVQFDPFTNTMFLFGDSKIVQIDISDPLNPSIKSTLDLSGPLAAKSETLIVNVFNPFFPIGPQTIPFDSGVELSRMDQGIVDGQGHLFAASNAGHLIFVDYSATGMVGDGILALDDTGMLPFLDANLDDLAPLVGLGGSIPLPDIPEPGAAGVWMIASMLILKGRRRTH